MSLLWSLSDYPRGWRVVARRTLGFLAILVATWAVARAVEFAYRANLYGWRP